MNFCPHEEKNTIMCAVTCTSPSELLLGVSPRSGMFASEWAVARRFTTLGFMCELERVVARGFSTLRYVCI